uniref:DNA ligase n=1 Tax=Mesocestoides corti TaxID=53468 RepID=A0A5K3EUW8_MESCO
MPQKSLLSFFSNKVSERLSDDTSSSPVTKTKRRRVVMDSDDSQEKAPGNSADHVIDDIVIGCNEELSNRNNTPNNVSKTEVEESAEISTRMFMSARSQGSHTTQISDKSSSIKKSEESLSSETSSQKSVSDLKVSNEFPLPSLCKSENESIGTHASIDNFDPSKDPFDPLQDACWGLSEPVPYIAFAKTLDCIEKTSSRLKMIGVLSNLFRCVGINSPKDLAMCINMSINRLGPSYEGLELGIGESLLIKALSLTTGASIDRIKSELNRLGDLGAVAEAVRSRQQTMFKPKSLTLRQVFGRLKEIALLTGNAAQTKKVKLIQTLLVACRECEAKYLIRCLQGKLRIGLAEQSVLAALGQAVAMTSFHSIQAVLADGQPLSVDLLDTSRKPIGGPDAWKRHCDEVIGRVKQAYAQCPNYEKIVESLLEDGPDNVHKRCCISPGIPLRPMLAHPTHGVTEVLKRFDQADFTCEFKYDGERAQIHLLADSTVRVYSRNQENNTSKYPDIVNSLVANVLKGAKLTAEACKLLDSIGESTPLIEGTPVTTFILDSEAVAWDRVAEQILPFQVLSTRKRKDVQEGDVKVCVCVYAFDLLYLNGIPLTEQPLRQRRELLRLVFPTIPGQFMFANSLDSSDTEEIIKFMDESIKGNCEGLMVKTLDHDATYEIAKRSRNWLKLKKDYLEGVGDTLDLVVIGGFHGSGKRTGRYGGFLLACYNPDDEEYQTICKVIRFCGLTLIRPNTF